MSVELSRASRLGDAARVRALLDQGADPMRAEPEMPSWRAGLDFLAESGIWLDRRGWLVTSMLPDSGLTPLMLAAREGHIECVQILCARGSARQVSSKGQSALMLALLRARDECALHLASFSDLESISLSGWSASSIAWKMASLLGSSKAELAGAIQALGQRAQIEQASDLACPGGILRI